MLHHRSDNTVIDVYETLFRIATKSEIVNTNAFQSHLRNACHDVRIYCKLEAFLASIYV